VDASIDGAIPDGIVDASGPGDTPLLIDGDGGDTPLLIDGDGGDTPLLIDGDGDGDGDGVPEVLPDADVAAEVLSDVEVVTPPDGDVETLGEITDGDGAATEVVDADTTADTEVVESTCTGADDCPVETCELVACVDGACEYSLQDVGAECDDGMACTLEDACDEEGGCAGTADDTECDDGNPCTASVCVAVGDLDCVTKSLENGTFCSDGDLCTEVAECQEGSCVVTSAVECPVENSCTTGTCDSTSGDCVFEPLEDGEDCEDGNKCTANDTCTEGVCAAGEAVDCNDENLCTTTACDAEAGCDDPEPVDEGTPCDLDNFCTKSDACDVTGTCVAGPKVSLDKCDDDNDCTVDDCDSTVCPCGGEDDCDPTACPCCGEDDGDPIAGPGGGACVHVNVDFDTDCDDENPCTNVDFCLNGVCAGTVYDAPGVDQSKPPFCDDGEQCTTDSCQENLGCKHSNLGANATCEDGSACTVDDTCKAGTCEPGDEIECPEGSECAISSCDDDTGCVVENLSEEEPCTTADENGACVLHQCDGEGGCGIQLAEGATVASGTFHDAKPLADGGWVLAGTVASDSGDSGDHCVSVVRLDFTGEVLWENSSICAGQPGDDGSRAFGLDVFEDGKVAVVGSVDTNPDTATLSPVLWIVSADGASVTTHFLVDEDSSGPAQDVIVLDDDSLMVLIDHPVGDAGTLRALVQQSSPLTDWDAPGLDHAWSFQRPASESPNEALDARRLFPVDASELRYGLVGTYSANDVIFQQAARIFDAAEGAPGEVGLIFQQDIGVIWLANDALYWTNDEGVEGYLLAGSSQSDGPKHGSGNLINADNKLIGGYVSPLDETQAVALFDQDLLLVASNVHGGDSEGHALVRLKGLDEVTGDPILEGEGPAEAFPQLGEVDLGSETLVYAIACQPEAACLVAGSRNGAPTWFIVDPNDKELAVCGSEAP
jgi:hypothetical protein